MASKLTSVGRLPTMHPATAQAINGRKRARAVVVKTKNPKTNTGKIQKKAVNSFVIYRCKCENNLSVLLPINLLTVSKP